jgi:hypothetical protein
MQASRVAKEIAGQKVKRRALCERKMKHWG